MATIIKRKSKYSVVYYVVDENGVKRQKWESFDTIVTTVEKRYKGHRQRRERQEEFFAKSASAKPRIFQWD